MTRFNTPTLEFFAVRNNCPQEPILVINKMHESPVRNAASNSNSAFAYRKFQSRLSGPEESRLSDVLAEGIPASVLELNRGTVLANQRQAIARGDLPDLSQRYARNV